jgi:phosphatidylglycerol:prolipoprotein diacylglycerol transferase
MKAINTLIKSANLSPQTRQISEVRVIGSVFGYSFLFMFPRIFSAPYFVLHTFGLFLAAAYLAALWWLMRGARREGLNTDRVAGLTLWIIIGAILGAKALMVFRALPQYLENPSDFLSLATLQSAGDFYGGFIVALAAAVVYFARHPDLPRWQLADLCGPAIALGQAIGRVGCFMAGDDYGSPTNLPWAVTFHDRDAAEIGGAPLGVPLHPVQLYESLMCLGLFFFLVWLARRKRFDGEIILAYSILYAIGRFLLEFVRGDADRGFVFGNMLSTSQFIAVIVLAICIPLLLIKRKNATNSTN